MSDSLSKISLKTELSLIEHQTLLKWVQKHLFIGGMPAAVQEYINTGSLLEAQRVHHRILLAYESDFGKYASQVQYKYL